MAVRNHGGKETPRKQEQKNGDWTTSAEKKQNKRGFSTQEKIKHEKEWRIINRQKCSHHQPVKYAIKKHTDRERERERERKKQKVGPNNSSRQDSYSAANSALCLYSFFRSFPIPSFFFNPQIRKNHQTKLLASSSATPFPSAPDTPSHAPDNKPAIGLIHEGFQKKKKKNQTRHHFPSHFTAYI